MGTKEAIAVVEAYRVRHGLPGTLEAMIAMQDDEDNHLLTPEESEAYMIVFNGMRDLFWGN